MVYRLYPNGSCVKTKQTLEALLSDFETFCPRSVHHFLNGLFIDTAYCLIDPGTAQYNPAGSLLLGQLVYGVVLVVAKY